MTYAACMHGFPAPWAPGADLHRSASAAEAGWHARRVGILGTTRRHQVYPLDARVGEGLQERGRALHRRAAAVHGRSTEPHRLHVAARRLCTVVYCTGTYTHVQYAH